jgi:exosortase
MLRENSKEKKLSLHVPASLNVRNLLFLCFNIIVVIIFYTPLKELVTLSLLYKPDYSHVVLIPFVSAYFVYVKRQEVFSNVEYSFNIGSLLILAGFLLSGIGWSKKMMFHQNDYLSLMTFTALIIWIGGFILFYGIPAFKNARFPLLFLVFMIPIPSVMLDNIVKLLIKGTTEVTYLLFQLTGVPFLREEYVFHFSEMSVEIADECSGIRSSIALFITSILAGHLFLKNIGRKTALSLSIFPITVFKNAVRIVTLTLLSVYVDKSFLTNSFLHRRGGIFFFILAVLLLLSVLWLLKKGEHKKPEISEK